MRKLKVIGGEAMTEEGQRRFNIAMHLIRDSGLTREFADLCHSEGIRDGLGVRAQREYVKQGHPVEFEEARALEGCDTGEGNLP